MVGVCDSGRKRKRAGEKIETGGRREAATNECSPKLKSSLMSPSIPLLFYSSISHSLSSALLLITHSLSSSQWEMLQVLPALSGFPSGRGGRDARKPVFTSQLFFFFLFLFLIMMCEIKILQSK